MKKSSLITAVTVMLGIIALAHLAVYEAFVRAWDIQSHGALVGLRIAFVVLAVSFVALSAATMQRYSKITSVLYTLAAVWLGTLYWLFLASVIAAIALVAGHGSAGSVVTARLVFILALVVSAGGIENSNTTRVIRYTVELPNLPETWRGKKVAVFSDTHLGNVRGVRFARKIVRMVNKENPELVLIAGDFFDGPAAPFEKFASPLKGIAAPKGAYFAEGNHEEFSGGSERYLAALRAAGVHVLSNEKRDVDGIQIAGVNYNVSNSDEAAAATLKKIAIDRDMPSILIKHAPTGIEAVAEAGIGLQVSGHTHRGQIWPGPLLTKRIFKEFEYGMHRKGATTFITSSGAGTWGPPQRVGTHAEIVIVTLEGK